MEIVIIYLNKLNNVKRGRIMSGKLKKASMKIMLISLTMIFTVQTLAVSQYPSETQTIKEDPYALMYDSDERLIEEINNLPDYFVLEEAIGSSVNTEMSTSYSGRTSINSKSIISASDTDEADMSKSEMVRAKEDIIQTIKTRQFDDIDQMDISDRLKDRVMDMREDIRQDRFIIRYSSSNKGDISSYISKTEEEIGIQEKHRSGSLELLILDEKVNPKELAATLKASGADETIEYIQPDFRLSYSSTQESLNLFLSESSDNEDNTYESADEGSATSIEAPAFAEDINASTELSEVIVAVIDTGIDVTHPGLADYIWHNSNDIPDDGADNDENGYIDDTYGWNFYSDNNSTYDSQYPMQGAHGTHISGIIASNTSNYNVKIMPLKVFGDNGAYTSDIIDAIYYAEANGAQIVNCSFGSTEDNPALREAIENSDMLFVCSVGNARTDLNETPIYPACFDLDNIVSVTSTNADGGLSYYSNYSNDLVDVAALGRDVYSTLPEGTYGKQSGTSMSAAQVSSVAAAVLCLQSDINITEIKTRLISTADMLSNLQSIVVDGRQINMDNAINNFEQTEVIENTPDNDFNVNGYNSAQNDLYQLYSSGDVIQVESGNAHTIVLKENGTVWSWGSNSWYQLGNGESSDHETLTQVIGLSNVVFIAANTNHNLAVKSDGTVWSWGYNGCGVLGNGTTTSSSIPVQVSGLTSVISVSAGILHSVALRSDGTVWTWGDNSYGQLGNGTTATYSTTPVQVSGLTNVTYISAGNDFCLAVKSNGTVWAWGRNSYGMLGNGTTNSSTLPVQVSGLTGVIKVAGGSYHSMAVKSDGTVWTWGNNTYGQLGNGTATTSTIPIQASSLTGIIKVAAGGYHSQAIKSDGTAWAWGYNNYGQLGDGTTTTQKTAVQINSLTGVIDINAATSTSVVAKSNGTVWTWGLNTYGQLGDGTADVETSPVQAINLSGVTYASAGYQHSIAVKSNGTVWAWGKNDYGQLGDGTTVLKTSPVQVSGLTNVTLVAAGKNHNLALKSDGTVWAWGYNNYGQLGNGTTTNKTTPVQVSGLTGVIGIAAGGSHSLAVKSDGTVWAWGNNSSGQLGDGTSTTRTTPKKVSSLTGIVGVAGGSSHSTALKSNGTVYCWGLSSGGQLGNGNTTYSLTPVLVSNISSVAGVAAGDYHCFAKKTDGTIWSWGENTYGQLGIGTTTNISTPVQVSALTGSANIDGGYYHSVAVKSDGTVWAWGSNDNGQLGIGTEDDEITPQQVIGLTGAANVSGGYLHCLAVKSDGTVWAWGNNSYGQLGDGHIINSTVPIQAQTYIPGVYFLEQSYIATIMPTTVTIPVSAQATDKYSVISNANIVYSLVNTYAGVSINSSTGDVTVTSTALPGSVQVKATYGSYNSMVTLVLEENNEVELSFLQQTYSTVLLPYTKTILVSAQATDENGEIASDAEIVYGLVNTYTGVTINSSTGVVTITNDALAGSVQLIATYENISCTATLILQDGGFEVNGEAELSITSVAGNQYDISLMTNNIASFNDTSFALTYDPAIFEALDLCAFTFAKETTAVTIQEAGITIISVTPGEVIFSVDKTIASNKKWSGNINIFEFKALSSSSSVISVTEYWT